MVFSSWMEIFIPFPTKTTMVTCFLTLACSFIETSYTTTDYPVGALYPLSALELFIIKTPSTIRSLFLMVSSLLIISAALLV